VTIEPPPSPGNLETIATAVVRATLSAVPWAGGALVEAVQLAASRGREKRLYQWFDEVSRAVNHLMEQQGRSWDDLANDDGFINAIGAATAAAAQTADASKLEALRNAVLNSTFQPDTVADRHAILMSLVVDLTGTHLWVLGLYDDPIAWYNARGMEVKEFMFGGPAEVLNGANGELAADTTLITKVVDDLRAQGLADISLNTTMTNQGIWASRTKPLGK